MSKHKVTHLFPAAEPESPRDDVLEAVRTLDEITASAASVIGGILDLKRHARSSYTGVQRAADAALRTARESLDSITATDPSFVDTGMFRAGRRLDDRLLAVRRDHLARRAGSPRSFQRMWVLVSLALTGVGVVAVIEHAWTVAALAVAVRCLINIRFADEHNLPFEGRSSGRRASTMVYRCLSGHASDAAILVAIVWVLMHAERPLWAIGSIVAIVVALSATLLRVAALQVGAQIYRLTLESVARSGSLLVALSATAMLQPHIPDQGLLWLGIALVGPLLYGIGETIRTMLRLHATDVAFGGSLPQVSITVCDEYGCRKLPSDVDRRRRSMAPGGRLAV